MRGINFKTVIGALALSLTAGAAFADELIEFRHVERDRLYGKASCYSPRMSSRAQVVKSTNIYQANLSRVQVKSILSERQFLDFERLTAIAQLKTRGAQAYAELQSTQIAVQLKNQEGEVISTTMFQWTSDEMDRLRQGQSKSLKINNQGGTECRAEGSGSKEVCKFDVSADISDQLAQAQEAIKDHYLRYRRSGLIVEVIYQQEARVDCSGKRSVAYAGGLTYEPLLILRDID